MVNGKAGGHIISKRGLRQGDPLSPLLFVLAVDSLARILQLAASAGLIEGLGPVGFRESIRCLQYADDTLVFCKAKPESLFVLKFLLYGFELASGLHINFHKSSLFLLEYNEDKHLFLANALNCKQGYFPLTYLGIPLRPGRLLREDWLPLIERVDKRLAGWKGASLSRGGDWYL